MLNALLFETQKNVYEALCSLVSVAPALLLLQAEVHAWRLDGCPAPPRPHVPCLLPQTLTGAEIQ